MVKINDVFIGTETGIRAKVTDISIEKDSVTGIVDTEIEMQVVAKSANRYEPMFLSLRKFISLVEEGKLVKE